MVNGRGASIMDHFQDLDDPRIERSKRHQLLDIVAIAICAVICGADLGFTWSCSARARRSGSAPSWTSPTVFPPTTPSVRSSPG